MPQAIPLIATYLASAAGLSGFWTSVIGLASSALTSVLISEDAEKARISSSLSQGIKLNTTDSSVAYPVIYGKTKLGGNRVFYHTEGTDNMYLWVVQNLGWGECEGLDQVAGVDLLYLDGRLYTEYGDKYSYWFHSGTSTQTYDTNLNAVASQWVENKHYICYLVHRFTYDRELYQGFPDVTAILKGKKLYDFRTSTTAWSQNPVLALYDWTTSDLYGDGYDSSFIDIASWTSAANYCDAKGIKINTRIDSLSKTSEDICDSILQLFRGSRNWWDGKFYLRYADLNYESSVFTLEDKHIAQSDSGKFDIKLSDPGQFTVPSGLWIRYVDAALNYTETRIPIGDPEDAADEITIDNCTDRELAGNIGTYLLERAQLSRVISLSARGDALRLEPGDIIDASTSALAIANQTMRVLRSTILSGGLISLLLAYESIDLYNDSYDISIEDVYTCTLPDPSGSPPSVTNVSCTEEHYSYRNRTFTKLIIEFDKPSSYPWFDYVEVRKSKDNVTWDFVGIAKTNFEILNIGEGETYYIRLKTVSVHDAKQPDEEDYKIQHNVAGLTDTPTSLAALYAIPGQNSVNLHSTMIDDSDVELYEFRLGSSWIGGIFLAATKAPNYSMQGVKPGNHTFWANVYLNNKVYGDTPRSSAISLVDPPDGWTVQTFETCDYNEGGSEVHDNTERIDSGGYTGYLKCSHTNGVLVGTYTSDIYDLTSSDRYLVYILADIVVVGGGTAWEDFVPDPVVWNAVGITTNKWSDLYAPLSGGPAVRMTLYYGETSPPTNSVSKMEILNTTITGRYFQAEIEITDPSDDVNAYVEDFTLKFCQ